MTVMPIVCSDEGMLCLYLRNRLRLKLKDLVNYLFIQLSSQKSSIHGQVDYFKIHSWPEEMIFCR